jgi:hypothetical protein
MKWMLVLVMVGIASCSLFDGMRRNSFGYKNGESLPLSIPKRFTKQDLETDGSGNRMQVFKYANGAELYFYYGDTTKEYFSIDTSMHIAKYYPGEVLYYKGQDSSSGLFWRENRYGNFRFGYRGVSSDREGWFDSSLNYAAWKLVDLAPIP